MQKNDKKYFTLGKQCVGVCVFILFKGIACLLLFAAGMKASQLAAEPSLSEGLFQARWFNTLVIEFELVFGSWLLFGFCSQLTHWASIGLFTLFAGVSLYKVFLGETNCGCFGSAQINPILTFVLDVFIVLLLLLLQHFQRKRSLPPSPVASEQSNVCWMFRILGYGLLLSFAVIIQGLLFFSPNLGFEPFLTDYEISFTINETSKGDKNHNEDHSVVITVLNKTNDPIKIVGVKTNCSSGGYIKGIPVTVPPKEHACLTFIATEIENKASLAKKRQTFLFFADRNGVKKVKVRLFLYKRL